jgi:HPt (histidine-containing phosphotransfer) domain-containing protein
MQNRVARRTDANRIRGDARPIADAQDRRMNLYVIDPHAFDELQATAGADFVLELVDTFAEEAPRLLAELHSALAAGAPERFRRAAHSLKSNSNTFGATRLAAMARAPELGDLPPNTDAVNALAPEIDTTLAALRALARQ